MKTTSTNPRAFLAEGADDGRALILRMIEAKWTTGLRARFEGLMQAGRYNLNSGPGNACAEALALSLIYRRGDVLAERDLVTYSGIDMLPGTPDGAVTLSSGGMCACQVVRAGAPTGHGGVKILLRTLLVKVYKSLCWLLNSGMGDTVCSFVIAAWIPQRLSNKALASLRGLLRRVGDIDRRFEIALMIPPPNARPLIFPKGFGSCRAKEDSASENDKRGLDKLLRNIHTYSLYWRHQRCSKALEEESDLGFLEALLGFH
jgi:hypothetical protein